MIDILFIMAILLLLTIYKLPCAIMNTLYKITTAPRINFAPTHPFEIQTFNEWGKFCWWDLTVSMSEKLWDKLQLCRKFWEVKYNFVSQCRKICEVNHNFVSQCQKIVRWITILYHRGEKFVRWNTIFRALFVWKFLEKKIRNFRNASFRLIYVEN